MGILHAAAALKLAIFSLDATEINNYVADANKEARIERVYFARDMITTNTNDKALKLLGTQIPTKNKKN